MRLRKEDFKDWALLIDGSSFIYRAYYAIQGHLSTSKGFPTKAIYGVTQMLLKILKNFNSEIIVWFADEKGPTFRHLTYKEYKATRPGMPDDLKVQISYIKRIVETLGIPYVFKEGYEADDLIASFVKAFPIKALIVAPDKDLYSLISERIILYDPVREIFFDKEDFQKKFGFEPEKFLEFRALIGDPSDNIKGIPGIGEKTAKDLIQRFGTLQNLLENIQMITPPKLRERILTHQQIILENLKLLKLKYDAELPSYELSYYQKKEIDYQTLKNLFKELEFKKFLKEFNFQTEPIRYEVQRINKENLLEILKQTDGLSFYVEEAQNLSLLLVPTLYGYFSPRNDLCLEVGLTEDILTQILTKRLFFFDFKSLLHILKDKINIRDIFFNIAKYTDLMLISYLIDPTKKKYDLSELSFSYLDTILEPKSPSCQKAVIIKRLSKYLEEELVKEDLTEWFHKVEMPLNVVLFAMENTGIKIDISYVKGLNQEFTERLMELEERLFTLAGCRFNPRSSQDVGKILFERLKLPKLKYTPKGTQPSTNLEVLEELKSHHPIIEVLLKYRNLFKLKSTYVDVLLKQTSLVDHRIRTNYNQTGTATGRLSSQNPNLQNIPLKGEEGIKIRRAFVAEEGCYLCSFDYSQIELRILAHFSKDEYLLSSFLRGEDIHSKTASEVFGVPLSEVTPEMRRIAKVINFGIVYGMSPYGLAKELNIDQSSAANYIQRYFARYPKVKEYIENITKFAQEKGYVKTISGRKRPIPEIFSSNRQIKELGMRIAINTPIQGSAADLIKTAMVAIFQEFLQRNLKSKLLLQVHDELVLEVPEDELEIIKDLGTQIMENPFSYVDLPLKFDVPLKVDFSYGKSWADCK